MKKLKKWPQNAAMTMNELHIKKVSFLASADNKFKK
jgi:hypothetical protein